MVLEEEEKPSLPNFEYINKLVLVLENQNKEKNTNELLKAVQQDAMLPFYRYLVDTIGVKLDQNLVESLQKRNNEELEKIEEKITDAKENLGDTEVRDALLAKADYYNLIGAKEEAFEAYQATYDKTAGIGGKIDVVLTMIRIAFFYEDRALIKKYMDKAMQDLEKGGDWERRNKLRVYQGLHFVINRDWKQAALKFLDAVATFTAVELMPFSQFVFYVVITSMTALDRPTLRDKVVNSPEILSAIKETPHLEDFLNAFFQCRYKDFMVHFVHIIDQLKCNRYLSRHVRFFSRCMRFNAYRQFLASYQSVTLQAMADAFGVSAAFIDEEISSFISSNKLTCKIDKVGGIIESNTGDERNKIYGDIIKQGDLVLNRIQKLSKVMDM